jgi:hypothetical protein
MAVAARGFITGASDRNWAGYGEQVGFASAAVIGRVRATATGHEPYLTVS